MTDRTRVRTFHNPLKNVTDAFDAGLLRITRLFMPPKDLANYATVKMASEGLMNVLIEAKSKLPSQSVLDSMSIAKEVLTTVSDSFKTPHCVRFNIFQHEVKSRDGNWAINTRTSATALKNALMKTKPGDIVLIADSQKSGNHVIHYMTIVGRGPFGSLRVKESPYSMKYGDRNRTLTVSCNQVVGILNTEELARQTQIQIKRNQDHDIRSMNMSGLASIFQDSTDASTLERAVERFSAFFNYVGTEGLLNRADYSQAQTALLQAIMQGKFNWFTPYLTLVGDSLRGVDREHTSQLLAVLEEPSKASKQLQFYVAQRLLDRDISGEGIQPIERKQIFQALRNFIDRREMEGLLGSLQLAEMAKYPPEPLSQQTVWMGSFTFLGEKNTLRHERGRTSYHLRPCIYYEIVSVLH